MSGEPLQAPEDLVDDIVRRLREVAKETPEEYVERWPYSATVSLESPECRALLSALRGGSGR